MKFIRIIAACTSFMLALVALITSLLMGCGSLPGSIDRRIDHSIEKSRHIERSFKLAAKYVNDFKNRNQRLPTIQEFDLWIKNAPPDFDVGFGRLWLETTIPDEAIKKFGPPTKDAFLIGFWRGEWYEYYASWVDRTSMEFDRSKYYFWGKKYAEMALFIGLAILTAVLGLIGMVAGRKLWPYPFKSVAQKREL
jgi:hypothetical protein